MIISAALFLFQGYLIKRRNISGECETKANHILANYHSVSMLLTSGQSQIKFKFTDLKLP